MLEPGDLVDGPPVEERRPAAPRGKCDIVDGPRNRQIDEFGGICPGERIAADEELLLDDLAAGLFEDREAAAAEFGQQRRFPAAGTARQDDEPIRPIEDEFGPKRVFGKVIDGQFTSPG
jgi:hypothetical protein